MEPEETESSVPVTPSPETTVLLVSHNCLDALKDTIQSLEASAARDSFEILVVDCGSRDGSATVDEVYPDVTVLRLPRNFGLTKARNIGVRTAKGEFLFLLTPGVRVEPDVVVRLTARIREAGELAAVAPLLTGDAGEPASRGGALPAPQALAAAWAEGKPWYETLPLVESGPEEQPFECLDPRAFLVRTQAVRGMNYFDERYGDFGSELDFFTQAYKASKKLLLLRSARAALGSAAEARRLRAEELVDYANGISAYTGKHYGWAAWLRVKLGFVFRALVRFDLGLLAGVLSGRIIDGSQP